MLEVLKELCKPDDNYETVEKMFISPIKVKLIFTHSFILKIFLQGSSKSKASISSESAKMIVKEGKNKMAFVLVSACAKIVLPILTLIFIIVYFVQAFSAYTNI